MKRDNNPCFMHEKIGISKTLIKALNLSSKSAKMLIVLLSAFDTNELSETSIVEYDAEKLFRFLGYDNGKSKAVKNQNLNRALTGMYEELQRIVVDHNGEDFRLSDLILSTDLYYGILTVEYNDTALDLVSGLKEEFYTVCLSDVDKMRNKNCWNFYRFILLHTDTRRECSHSLTTSALKELFGQTMADYTYSAKDDDGDDVVHFQRSKFENRCLNPIVAELSSMLWFKDICYEKIYHTVFAKRSGKTNAEKRVDFYHFEWSTNIDSIKWDTESKEYIA